MVSAFLAWAIRALVGWGYLLVNSHCILPVGGSILPVVLDVGTNNDYLLDNPLYMGARHPRIPDNKYYPFLDKFIVAIEKRWPGVLLQFEDFALKHATPLLKKY